MTKGDKPMSMRLELRRMLRRFVAFGVVAAFFLIGYNSITASTQSCSAQYSITPPIVASPLPPTVPVGCGCGGFNSVPCTIPGSTAVLTAAVEAAYYTALTTSSVAVENYIGMAVDSLVQTVFSRLEQTEQDLNAWLDTYWYYNYKPSLQAKVEQANVAGMDQAQQIASQTDAQLQNRVALDVQEQDARSAVGMSDVAGDETCAVATTAGVLGNANAYGRAMRRAWQNDSNARGLNRRGTVAARGNSAVIALHDQEFQNLFCDPRDNGGHNACGASDEAYYNADIQVTGRLFNVLTIPVDRDDRNVAMLDHMFNNMLGRPLAEPIDAESITAANGKQAWIERRSYLARKNASRAILSLIAGWRIPGGADNDGQNCTGGTTQTTGSDGATTSAPCSFVAAMRQGAGVPLQDLTDNPSYREILHAMTVDRFNSGDYAIDKIGSAERQEMEKVVLNAMYLMQLRDYYELLERTALALAVQVAVMTDQYPLPDVRANVRGAR